MREGKLVLSGYLAATGPVGVFARWVVEERPDAKSLGVFAESRLVGVAILGPSIGLPQSASCWIFCACTAALTGLFEHLRKDKVGPVSFPLRFLNEVAKQHNTSIDRLYVMPGSQAAIRDADSEVEVLTRQRLAEIIIPDELVRYIGRIETIPDGYPYYGIVRNNTLVSLAEAAVRDSGVAAIQQVATVLTVRRQGLGRSVVAHVAQDLLARGVLPTYLTAESNRASVSLAEAVGFERDSCWGYTEL